MYQTLLWLLHELFSLSFLETEERPGNLQGRDVAAASGVPGHPETGAPAGSWDTARCSFPGPREASGLDRPSDELTSTPLLVRTAGTDCVARGQKRHNL